MSTDEHREPSLDQLTRAFAEAMGRQAPVENVQPVTQAAFPATTPQRDPDEGCPISPKTILEAILFVGHPENQPITAESVSRLLRNVSSEEVRELVIELNAEYQASGMPFHVAQVGDGFELRLDEAFEYVRDRFYGRMRQVRLSQAAIDVLALVAYNQPVTREEVDKLLNNGTQSARLLNQLVRRDLLARQTTGGKPKRREYVTTERFLTLFQLEELSDLPRSEDPS